MPHARRLHAGQVAKVVTTLDAHGRRAEAKRHRALWAGRGRDFTILGFRRFAALPEKYAVGTGFSPIEDDSVEAVSVDRYRELVDEYQTPERAGYARLRKVALVALRTGTMTAAGVLEHTRPAALALTMAAVYDGAGDERPGERRAADDLRHLIAHHASEQLSGDPKRWARAVARANHFEGTVLQLLADPDTDPDTDPCTGRGPDRRRRIRTDFDLYISSVFDAANILLALAPRDVAGRALVTKGAKRWITTAAGNGPLCRALVEQVVTRGTVSQRELLAANEFTPDTILARLMDRGQRTGVMAAIMERDEVGQEIAERACASVPRDHALKDWIAKRAVNEPAKALSALRSTADDPAWMLGVLRFANEDFPEPVRIAAYVVLAEMAGVEAVWALELERTETLEAMAPYVRATMATGDAGPLIEAARNSPVPESRLPWYHLPLQVTEEEVDHPLVRPLEDLIRAHLDGRVDRWLELADLPKTKPDPGYGHGAGVPLADLIRYLPSEVEVRV